MHLNGSDRSQHRKASAGHWSLVSLIHCTHNRRPDCPHVEHCKEKSTGSDNSEDNENNLTTRTSLHWQDSTLTRAQVREAIGANRESASNETVRMSVCFSASKSTENQILCSARMAQAVEAVEAAKAEKAALVSSLESSSAELNIAEQRRRAELRRAEDCTECYTWHTWAIANWTHFASHHRRHRLTFFAHIFSEWGRDRSEQC